MAKYVLAYHGGGMAPPEEQALARRVLSVTPPQALCGALEAAFGTLQAEFARPGAGRSPVAGRSTFACALKAGGPVNGHCPSIDRLFSSAARTISGSALLISPCSRLRLDSGSDCKRGECQLASSLCAESSDWSNPSSSR